MSKEITEKEKFINKLNFLLNVAKESNDEEYFNLLNEELVNFMLDYTDYYEENEEYDKNI